MELFIEHPDPTTYRNVPSELELGDVVFEVTVAVSPYFKVVLLYVVGLRVLAAREIVKVPFVTDVAAVYESELLIDIVGVIEYTPAAVGLVGESE